MDFKAPIDITTVLTAVKKHRDILKAEIGRAHV